MADNEDTQLKFALSNDFQTVAVTLNDKSVPLSPSQLDAVLEELGGYRGLMKPEVPFQLSASQVKAIENPTWLSQPVPTTGDSVLHLRAPRFVWLSYFMPREAAAKLGRLLTNQSAATKLNRPSAKQ